MRSRSWSTPSGRWDSARPGRRRTTGSTPGRGPAGDPRERVRKPTNGHDVTWLELPENTGFGPANLPYGVFSTPGSAPRTGIAVGDHVLDLAAVTGDPAHASGSLNAFMALGPAAWGQLREQVAEWLTERRPRRLIEPHLLPRAGVHLHLPLEVADY